MINHWRLLGPEIMRNHRVKLVSQRHKDTFFRILILKQNFLELVENLVALEDLPLVKLAKGAARSINGHIKHGLLHPSEIPNLLHQVFSSWLQLARHCSSILLNCLQHLALELDGFCLTLLFFFFVDDLVLARLLAEKFPLGPDILGFLLETTLEESHSLMLVKILIQRRLPFLTYSSPLSPNEPFTLV